MYLYTLSMEFTSLLVNETNILTQQKDQHAYTVLLINGYYQNLIDYFSWNQDVYKVGVGWKHVQVRKDNSNVGLCM